MAVPMICKLALEDGTVATGESVGAPGTTTGEVVFNTAMTGYQEIITDPSYRGQIVVMTSPQIGNYGVNEQDGESDGTHLSGLVMRECARRHSNHRATGSLSEFLTTRGVPGISGVDTRGITRRLRTAGAMRGALSTEVLDDRKLVELARSIPVMEGRNLAREVMPAETYAWTEPFQPDRDPERKYNVVAIDCGIKRNILRSLVDIGSQVHVVPGHVGAEQILAREPTGVLVGNGPGDPASVTATIETLKNLVGRVPIFAICLGHQMLALALGGKTYKLSFGHHGANHPVLNMATSRVEITSQNHGFAVDADSLETANLYATHTSLYDGSLEGFAHRSEPLFAVQYHPEAAPGPHDSTYLFDIFADNMRTHRPAASFATRSGLPDAWSRPR